MNFMLAGVLSLFNVIGGIIYYESNLNKAKDEQNYQIIKNSNMNEIEDDNQQINIQKNLSFFSVLNNKNILIPLFLVFFFLRLLHILNQLFIIYQMLKVLIREISENLQYI